MADPHKEEYVELLEVLTREESASIGYESDQIYTDQIDALKRYNGQNYGDEQPGRSQVHDRTVFETIEWLRPDLERVFVSGGSSATIEPWGDGTAEAAEDASDYLNHLFTEEMEGGNIVDTFAFDGLLQKRGVGAVYWEDAELGEPETQEIDLVRLQALQAQGVQLLEVVPKDPDNPEAGATVTYQRVKKQAMPVVQVVAPEDFRMTARAISLERPRYCGHIERHTKSDLKSNPKFEGMEAIIEEYAQAYSETADIDERRSERFWDEDEMYKNETAASEATTEVRLWREYIYHDKDGDGFAELLEVCRLEGVILTCEPVDDNPYFSWTPIPIPHRWFGLSVYDISKDIQKIKTTLLRGALDSVYLSVAPRMMANKNVNLSDLLTVRPGAVVRTSGSGPVGSDVMPLITPDMSGSAMGMLEVVDQMAERRTGVNRNAQGMDPDALNKTATGIKLMQNAASIRKEQIARNLGRGLEQMFRKIYRLVVSEQDGPRSIHIGKGQFKEYDPSQWPPEAKIRVHVGNGSGDRETQLGQLMQVLGMQREWVANYGAGNPIVGIKELHNTVDDMGRVMGMRSMDQYFKDPEKIAETPEGQQALQAITQPKPDPKAQEGQAKLKLEEQKMQMQMQGEQAKMQQAAQMDQAKMQMDQQNMQMKAQQEAEAAQRQSLADAENKQMDMALKREQLVAEMELKREQLAAELMLKREMMTEELALKRELGLASAATSANGAGTSGVHIGGEPG